MTWKEIILQILCRIYEIYDGDCAELGIVPNPAIPRVSDITQGALPEQGQGELAIAIDDLESHLALPENDLEAKYNNMLNEMITRIRLLLGEA